MDWQYYQLETDYLRDTESTYVTKMFATKKIFWVKFILIQVITKIQGLNTDFLICQQKIYAWMWNKLEYNISTFRKYLQIQYNYRTLYYIV
jgi:hypothetical protein